MIIIYLTGSDVTRVPGRYSEICTSTSSYTAQRSDELSFEAGANIYIILQNGGGWYRIISFVILSTQLYEH